VRRRTLSPPLKQPAIYRFLKRDVFEATMVQRDDGATTNTRVSLLVRDVSFSPAQHLLSITNSLD